MSLRITRLHPCREYWFAGVFWSCSVFFVSTHVGRFFWAIRPICCTGISPSLERRGEGFGRQHTLYPTLHGWMYVQAGGRWMQRLYLWVCMYGSVRESTHVKRVEPITAHLVPLPPCCLFFGLLHPPHLSGFCCSISHSLRCSLWHTHTRTHTHTQRETDMHTHAYEHKSSYNSPVPRAD